MKTLTQTTRIEALRCWALGEIDSEFFKGSATERHSVQELLISGALERVESGLLLFCKWSPKNNSLFASIPNDTKWYTALLDVSVDEFRNLRTISTCKWGEYSQGTYELAIAAATIKGNPDGDPRIASIRESLAEGKTNLTGITLLSESSDGPYTIAEGNGRLIALYLDCVLNEEHSHCPKRIDLILGITSGRWKHSPLSQ